MERKELEIALSPIAPFLPTLQTFPDPCFRPLSFKEPFRSKAISSFALVSGGGDRTEVNFSSKLYIYAY